MKEILGIDVGGTGIKGAIVNVETGELQTDRIKLKTARPASPETIGEQVKELVKIFHWKKDAIGIGFPAVIKDGHSLTAANIHKSWIGYPIQNFFEKILDKKVYMINDADAAGLAESTFAKSFKNQGLEIFLTIGTGIGSALFMNGVLIPNTELGHLTYRKSIAEKYVSNLAREKKKLSWPAWGKELNTLLNHMDYILHPKQFIIGGGISKKFDKYEPYLNLETAVTNAELLNAAGVIGAAIAAKKQLRF